MIKTIFSQPSFDDLTTDHRDLIDETCGHADREIRRLLPILPGTIGLSVHIGSGLARVH